jgi:hypothetical protein
LGADALELPGGSLLEGGEEPHRGEVYPDVEPPVLLYDGSALASALAPP